MIVLPFNALDRAPRFLGGGRKFAFLAAV